MGYGPQCKVWSHAMGQSTEFIVCYGPVHRIWSSTTSHSAETAPNQISSVYDKFGTDKFSIRQIQYPRTISSEPDKSGAVSDKFGQGVRNPSSLVRLRHMAEIGLAIWANAKTYEL
jgi:hypothetical protein